MLPKRDGAASPCDPTQQTSDHHEADTTQYSPNGSFVSWWTYQEWTQKYLDTSDPYPLAGTPEWCALPDNDRRKWAAAIDAGSHHVLRMETAQTARIDASKAVAGAENWSRVAQEIRDLNDFHARNPWAKRVSA